ncbi:C-type lectin domain family 2 member D-related protein [Varanus komodoensis]|nr:C-type lectin domain family 2 member D-related protein [Varanus komodoensis]
MVAVAVLRCREHRSHLLHASRHRDNPSTTARGSRHSSGLLSRWLGWLRKEMLPFCRGREELDIQQVRLLLPQRLFDSSRLPRRDGEPQDTGCSCGQSNPLHVPIQFSDLDGMFGSPRKLCLPTRCGKAQDLNFLRRYKTPADYWIGLRRDLETDPWRWIDGTIFNNCRWTRRMRLREPERHRQLQLRHRASLDLQQAGKQVTIRTPGAASHQLCPPPAHGSQVMTSRVSLQPPPPPKGPGYLCAVTAAALQWLSEKNTPSSNFLKLWIMTNNLGYSMGPQTKARVLDSARHAHLSSLPCPFGPTVPAPIAAHLTPCAGRQRFARSEKTISK